MIERVEVLAVVILNIDDFLNSVRSRLPGLVHPSAREDPIVSARHSSFILSHLISGLAALACLPVYYALSGSFGLVSALAFVWLILPIGTGVFLSKTGKLEQAYLLSALNLFCLVTYVTALTGGLQSFLLAWMIVIPLEAALSGNRKVIGWSFGFVVAGLCGLSYISNSGLIRGYYLIAIDPAYLNLIGSLSAAAYCGGLAVAIQTIHQRSSEMVVKNEQKFRLLAENSTDLITRHDENGNILFASPACQILFGVPAKDLLGDRLVHMIHFADRPTYFAAFKQCVEKLEQASVEFRVKSRKDVGGEYRLEDHSFIWVEMRCRPAVSDVDVVRDKSEVQIVAVTRDVSEGKAQELILGEARREAESANHAKTQFLANISHELRTPLNAVIGFSEILDRELFGELGGEKNREYAHLINESGRHLLGVVNDILDMSKIESGMYAIEKLPFKLGPIVSSCCEILDHAAEEKSVQLSMKMDSGLPDIIGDVQACKQILMNLLSNAIKFSVPNGCVEVRAKVRKSMIEVSVSDDGIGIEEDQIPKLGKPFVQVDSSYRRNFEGTGLGLSIVYGLVSLHGGEVTIKSEKDVGTTVSFTLPADGMSNIDAKKKISAESMSRNKNAATGVQAADTANA